MTSKLFQFVPQYKETIWGGQRLLPFKGLQPDGRAIGESWEVSGVPGHESVIADGPDKGLTLDALCAREGATLLGKDNWERFGTSFPLLIKFIDAAQPLSVQVHPDDNIAQERHHCPGKTEMWYMVDTAPDAYILDGFSHKITPDEYASRVADQTLPEVLRRIDVRPGDVFFLPPGRVHSIGPGCFICEIQETSDITYRIYDFGRTDSQGRQRQLHIEEARDVISYAVSEPDTTPVVKDNEPQTVVSCRHFTTSVYRLTESITCDYSDLDSFVILICTSGTCDVRCDGESVTLRAGQTVLLSAAAEHVVLEPSVSATLLECYV